MIFVIGSLVGLGVGWVLGSIAWLVYIHLAFNRSRDEVPDAPYYKEEE